MKYTPTIYPAELVKLSFEWTRLMWEAQAVIAMRMMAFGGMWGKSPGEEMRMVTEKQKAFWDSHVAMTAATMRGATPTDVLSAGIRPLHRKTKANVKRLTRKGPVLIHSR